MATTERSKPASVSAMAIATKATTAGASCCTAPQPRRDQTTVEAEFTANREEPANPYYQGYVDPGTPSGRGPTSGELQSQWMAKEKETYAPDGTPNEPAHPEAKTSDQ